MNQHALIQYLPLLILVPVLAFRLRQMSKPQPLKLGRLWIRPVLLLVAAGVVLFLPQPGHQAAPHITPLEWAGMALAAMLGAVGGWHWGRTMHIEVHPENGTLMTQGNSVAILVLFALIAFRVGVRPLLVAEGGAMHLDVLLITDASIVFSVMLFSARSLEMYLRARKVMEDAGRGAV